mmetsp:Transcript_47022/g.135481  ORF Transcript_47022/g.135481 Transcript_47022/m.135481 type:complete len:373 (+) Transcript_47022:113-1231(+)
MGACGSGLAVSSPLQATGADGLGKAWLLDGGGVLEFGSAVDIERNPNAEKQFTSSSAGAPARVGFSCRRGVKRGDALPNQDAWGVYLVPENLAAFGVFDGHGEKGHWISELVKGTLLKGIAQHSVSSVDPTPAVKQWYRQVHRTMCSNPKLGAMHSGTTATVVVHDVKRGRLVVSHVGDSKAVLLKQSGKKLVAEALTRDHRPELHEERERITRMGGSIVYDGRCHRVSWPGGDVSLNMSRSLGDAVAHDACGVSEECDLRVHRLCHTDKAIIIGSDGMWDVISPQEAASIVSEFAPERAMDAARRLADEAVTRWYMQTEGRVVDDTTVLIAWLPALAPPGTAVAAAPAVPACQDRLAHEGEHKSPISPEAV